MTIPEVPQNDEETNSQLSMSRGSSVHGPYREGPVDNSFPRCHVVKSIAGNEETYSRSLLTTGNGFALWDVAGSHIRGPDGVDQMEGISIGDVGIIDPNGQFIFGFNIFTSAEDSLHKNRVPDDFKEMDPPLDRASEVQHFPDHFSPGSIISSQGVKVTKLSADPLKVTISSTAREGAVLLLPHGGSRQDLVSTSRLKEYINEHALNWYRYICQYSRTSARMVPNGSLYLVTGCDSAKAWCTLSFPSKWQYAGRRIEMTYEGEGFPPWSPSIWGEAESMGRAEGKDRNFCVFIRGIRISVSNRLWDRHLPRHPPEQASYYNILSTPILGIRARIAWLRERLLREPEILLDELQKFPFHPSIVISQVLLEQNPAADIVTVDDSVWCPLAEGGDGTLPCILDLVVEAVTSSQIVTVDRLVSLVPKSSTPSPADGKGFFMSLLTTYAAWRTRQRVLKQVKRIMESL